MSRQDFLTVSLIVLLPIGIILLNSVLFLVGKFFWFLLSKIFPKLEPKLIEFYEANTKDTVDYLTGIVILYTILFTILLEIS